MTKIKPRIAGEKIDTLSFKERELNNFGITTSQCRLLFQQNLDLGDSHVLRIITEGFSLQAFVKYISK
jgi:hypothetical protein